jgi:hypothetical protein
VYYVQYPNRQPRRGIHLALIIVGVLAFIPFLAIAFLFAGLSSLSASNGDSGARDIILVGAILVIACAACVSGVIMQRRGKAVTTPSPGPVVGAHMPPPPPPPPPPVAAPVATRAPAVRLISVALGTLAAAVLIPFALIGLSVVAGLAGVSLTPFVVVGVVAVAVAGVYRLIVHRRHKDSD